MAGTLSFTELWRAEAAVGALVASGYRRRRLGAQLEPGDCCVREQAGFCFVEFEAFVWTPLMYRRLLLLDSARLSEFREAAGCELEACRVLSQAFPDALAALSALEALEGEGA